MQTQIINCETGEIIERPMNEEELKIKQENDAVRQKRLTDKNEAEIAKKLLLEKLGITEQEAKLLLS